MYSEILQDSVFDLIDAGKITKASGVRLLLQLTFGEIFAKDPEKYRKAITLPPA